MPTIVQINSFDSGSTGNIAKQINTVAEKHGYKTYFLFGRYWKGQHEQPDTHIKIGIQFDCFLHLIKARLFDALGLGSRYATKKLIQRLEQLQPDIVHLHNIHGYYVNYPILFNYFKEHNIRVVWTLHDCWAMTGHCSYFDYEGCTLWQSECHHCPLKKEYPKSLFIDRSTRNFRLKKQLFTSLGNRLTVVPVSHWLETVVRQSFFKETNILTIYNGVDVSAFRPVVNNTFRRKYNLQNKFVGVACAAPWSHRKGFDDYIRLSQIISDDVILVMVGLTEEQIKTLPQNIIGLTRINQENLVEIYSAADVVLNLSYEETLGMTTIEGMACGTPSIVYNATASPELVDERTGYVMEKGDVNGVNTKIEEIKKNGKQTYSENCIKRVDCMFDKVKQYNKYIDLYNNILNK